MKSTLKDCVNLRIIFDQNSFSLLTNKILPLASTMVYRTTCSAPEPYRSEVPTTLIPPPRRYPATPTLVHWPCIIVNLVGGRTSRTSFQVLPGPKMANSLFNRPIRFSLLISKCTPPKWKECLKSWSKHGTKSAVYHLSIKLCLSASGRLSMKVVNLSYASI